MTQKSWKTVGYIIDFKNGSRYVFFSEKGAVSNFFFEKGAVGQKRLGTCGLDNRLTDGGKVVSPTHRPHFTLKKLYVSVSGSHFC
jgi:hypothetical protein